MKSSEVVSRLSRPAFVERLEERTLLSIAPIAQLPDASAATGTTPAAVDLNTYFNDPTPTSNLAIFNTTLGTIPVLLTPGTTPLTVANFLSYVNSGAYTDTLVHRSVQGFIWQSGGYSVTNATPPNIATIPTNAAVMNEFGASNVRGTIAMAKLGSDPNSATDQFFFNESDSNASNLDNQNGGFTVFGHVLDAAGLAVMDAIGAVPVPSPGPFSSPLDQIPLRNYTSGKGVTTSNLILINSITQASDYFSVASDSPAIATASVQGSSLSIVPVSAGTAHLTVTAYSADGVSSTETFAVNVTGFGASTLTPAASGTVPSTVVAGQPAKIQQTVTLSDSSTTVNQVETVALAFSTNTSSTPSDYTIASTKKTVKLKPSKSAKVKVASKVISSVIPAGVYHVLVTVTDPSGANTSADTGQTVTVAAPAVDLSGSFLKSPTTVKIGHNGKVQVAVINNGNITAVGSLSVSLSASSDQSLANATALVTSPARVVHIKPGKTMKLSLSFPAGTTAGSYYLVADVDPANVFSDVSVANNVFATTAQIAVS